MSNPFLSSGLRDRYRHGMIVDLVLATGAACVWLDLTPVEIPKLDLVPAWIWPSVAAFFLASAARSYWRHRGK